MGKPQTPEHRAKIGAAMKAYHKTCKGKGDKKESTPYVAVGSAGAEAKKIKERLAEAKAKAKAPPIVKVNRKSGYVKKKIKTKTKPKNPFSLPLPGATPAKPSRAEFAAQVVRFRKLEEEGIDEDEIDLHIMELKDSLKVNKARFGKTQGYADLKMLKASLVEYRDNM